MKTRIRLLALVLAAVLCWGLFPYSVIFAEFDEHDFAESDFAEPDIAESATPYENEYTEPVAYSPSFFLPDNMRGIIISPEVDFLLSPGDSADEVNMQLDAIFDYIEDIGINAVYIKTSVEDRAYYDLDMNRNGRTDFLKLAVERAQSRHLGVYIIFDIGRALKAGGSDAPEIDRLSSEAHRLTIKYPCDGIILDDYYNDPEVNDFPAYMRNGSGIGYENWLYDSTEYLFGTASAVVRMTNNTIPVGVMINDVWANASSMPGGSPTNDSVQAFFDGFADTKKYVEQGYADFLLLRCYGSLTDTGLPFDDTAEWWGELCEASGIPMYLIHYNEKIGNGWAEDQLLRQLKTAKEDVPAYSGSIFNSYAALRENTLNSAGKLKEYFAGLIDEESLMQDLEMYSPKNLNFTTFEPIVEFAGRFDSNFDVYFNGSKITLNEAGNFYFPEPLQIGMNTFTIRHKDRTYTYRIERRIIVMREID
ncbi:MAG: family 10 glycosylhydrolase, partial [Oscillospiraceae bacterium]|nr:family 10 glycosylhydrolase [Oscillospiraceae bacterium]